MFYSTVERSSTLFQCFQAIVLSTQLCRNQIIVLSNNVLTFKTDFSLITTNVQENGKLQY